MLLWLSHINIIFLGLGNGGGDHGHNFSSVKLDGSSVVMQALHGMTSI